MKLSILDQTQVGANSNATQTLYNCISLAKLADQWGYHRFWVTEHHDTRHFACASPEVLMARLAAETTNIRIGAGGILLPNHSALRVAENFNLLEALYPGRIDLGVGRGGSETWQVRQLLHPGHSYDLDSYFARIQELSGFLGTPGAYRANGMPEQVRAVPATPTRPEQWLLSSSTPTAKLAADLGLRLSYAHFINPSQGLNTVQEYNSRFKKNTWNECPEVSIAVFVVCAEEESEVERLLKEVDTMLLRITKHEPEPLNRPSSVPSFLVEEEQVRIHENRKKVIWGTPKVISNKLLTLARSYGAGELMLMVHSEHFRDKLNAYRLVAEACLLDQ